MKKKKLSLILTVLTLCMALSACSENKTGSTEISNVPSVTPTLEATSAPTSEAASDPTPTAPVTPTLTMDKAVEVNTVAHLLEKYKTVTYAQLDYIGGDNIHVIYYKDEDGNNCFTEDDNGYASYRTDYFDFSRMKGQSEYHFSAMKYRYISEAILMVTDSEFTSRTTDANGNLVCETQAEISQEYADQLSKSWTVTNKDKMITKTVFAPDDYRMLSIDYSIRRPDGSESMIASGVLIYNKEVTHADAVQGYLDAEKVSVSIQMDDGTTRTGKIPKGETFNWICDDGYSLYLDKDGKILLPEQPDPVKGDLTLYCLPNKSN